ncbi:hypothetical protein C4572_02300 [Candidatus Parcubacteria bacterium]|nr:MAG: hypothetical protein C4572_02300 [Candidatus Parcubacteria bacterium]
MFGDFSPNKIAKIAILTILLSGSAFWTFPALSFGFYKFPFYIAAASNNLKTFKYQADFSEFNGSADNKLDAFVKIMADKNQKYEKKEKAGSVPVLLYHGLLEEPDGKNILRKDFIEQMFTLKKAGYETVNLEDFHKFVKGEKELPEKSFLLTFDDGRKDSYYPTDPILKALDYEAVQFVITVYSLTELNNKYYLNDKELLEMKNSGRWDLQPHTKGGHNLYKISPDGTEGHFYSNKIWLEKRNRLETMEEFKNRIYGDFLEAKEELEKGVGVEAYAFAFPFGDYGQESINIPAEEAKPIVFDTVKKIYPMAFYQTWGGNGFSANVPGRDMFYVKRIDVDPAWSGQELLAKLEAGQNKALPYVEDFDPAKKNWLQGWGRLEFGDGRLKAASGNDLEGTFALLDGTHGWTDYAASLSLSWLKGKSVSAIVRFQDNDNYASCDLSGGWLRIKEKIEGKEKILAAEKMTFDRSGDGLKLSVLAKGSNLVCIVNEERGLISDKLSVQRGGFGVKSWDPQKNNSEYEITGLTIDELK